MTTTQPHNPFCRPEKLAQRVKEIQTERAAGAIAAAEPLPKERGFIVQRALLAGVPVHLKFDQQPPAGSIPVPATPHKGKWLGYLTFLDPTGEAWKVPDIWYNQTWQTRMDYLEWQLKRCGEKAQTLQAEEKTLAAIKEPNQHQRWLLTETRSSLRQNEKNHRLTEQYLNHIRRHARPDGCPCLHPIPKHEPAGYEEN